MTTDKFRDLSKEEKEKEYAAKKKELKLLDEVAPRGSHKDVCEKVGISQQYSKQIRAYDGAKGATTENYFTVSSMVKYYREAIEEERLRMTI